jgi:mRNA-degrading endonuclease toxin of MazEF toxin-antitoxin module
MLGVMGRVRSILVRLARGGGPTRTGGAPGRDGVRIVYAPDRDGDPDPGEVVWAWVPYEDDPAQGKDRPVLVIGYDGRGGRLVAVPLSSRDPAHKRDAGEWVPVGAGSWDRERRESFANADRVLRYAPGEVRREGAALPRDRFDAVVAMARALGRIR